MSFRDKLKDLSFYNDSNIHIYIGSYEIRIIFKEDFKYNKFTEYSMYRKESSYLIDGDNIIFNPQIEDVVYLKDIDIAMVRIFKNECDTRIRLYTNDFVSALPRNDNEIPLESILDIIEEVHKCYKYESF